MIRLLDRHWLLTSTTYGTWLPGDRRGFVSPLHGPDGKKVIHNVPSTPYDADHSALRNSAKLCMTSTAVRLTAKQAAIVLKQFQQTCTLRNWICVSGSVMANHFHVVVSVPGDPDPAFLLRDLKSYASRSLNLASRERDLADDNAINNGLDGPASRGRQSPGNIGNDNGINSAFNPPLAQKWWTSSGSRRKLSDENAVAAAARYVWNQEHWLSRMIHPDLMID
jgi:hypothetical protein